MAALPFALVGGIWLLYLLSSVAVILAGQCSIMWDRHRLGGHERHCGADGGRHDHGAAGVDVRDSRRVPVDAAAAGGEGR